METRQRSPRISDTVTIHLIYADGSVFRAGRKTMKETLDELVKNGLQAVQVSPKEKDLGLARRDSA